jgi:hypothetical protein
MKGVTTLTNGVLKKGETYESMGEIISFSYLWG